MLGRAAGAGGGERGDGGRLEFECGRGSGKDLAAVAGDLAQSLQRTINGEPVALVGVNQSQEQAADVGFIRADFGQDQV